MKKMIFVLLTFAVVGMLSVFTGCGEEKETSSIGVSESSVSDSSEVETEAEAETEAAAEETGLVGVWEYEAGGYTYTFNEDGTGQYDLGGTIMKLTYEDKGTILFEGNTDPMELEYSMSDGKLIIIDSLGDEVVYKRK